MNNKINWMQQGWECPKCGAAMSPSTSCCVNCRGNDSGSIAVTAADLQASIQRLYKDDSCEELVTPMICNGVADVCEVTGCEDDVEPAWAKVARILSKGVSR